MRARKSGGLWAYLAGMLVWAFLLVMLMLGFVLVMVGEGVGSVGRWLVRMGDGFVLFVGEHCEDFE